MTPEIGRYIILFESVARDFTSLKSSRRIGIIQKKKMVEQSTSCCTDVQGNSKLPTHMVHKPAHWPERI